MKRLLCIISSLDTGGAETFLMKLYRTLSADEYQMDFVVAKDGGYYTNEVLMRGGKIYVVPLHTKHPFKVFRELQRIVRENGYTYILKLGDSPIGAVDLLAARAGGAKILAHRSCNALTGLSWKKKLRDTLFRPVLNRVANVKIAPSVLAAQYTFGLKQLERGNVALLHNGVDLGVFCFDNNGRKQIRKEFALEGKLVVGHIGRLSRQKNHRFLLRVFREIKSRQENAVLLLVGTGELENEIRRQAKELEIADAVIFTGVRSDVSQLLSAMDVFVFPSFHEGMPNTVIEAQATGLPCVIANTITKEADITGLVQYLPLSESAENWAQKALNVDREERKDTKQAFIVHSYDIGSVAKQFVELVFAER